MSLARRAGLLALARRHVSIGGPCEANSEAKIACGVVGMAAGADSIDDMDVRPARTAAGYVRLAAALASTLVARGLTSSGTAVSSEVLLLTSSAAARVVCSVDSSGTLKCPHSMR